MKVDVIIPTYRPDGTFCRLIKRLGEQTFAVNRVILLNTEESLWEEAAGRYPIGKALAALPCPYTLSHIKKKEFDHGATRMRGAGMSEADVILFMTQDAVPADARLVERLVRALGLEAEGCPADALGSGREKGMRGDAAVPGAGDAQGIGEMPGTGAAAVPGAGDAHGGGETPGTETDVPGANDAHGGGKMPGTRAAVPGANDAHGGGEMPGTEANVPGAGRASGRCKRPEVAVAYARQLPRKGCSVIERYTRQFNYPKVSQRKRKEDIGRLGIKTFFCSDVCAAYQRELFLSLGGFEYPAIFNEDMVFAAKAVQAGYAVQYAAEAKVVHSHDYTAGQQFRRNFDLAVSQAGHPEIFGAASSEAEGLRLVRGMTKYLFRAGKPWLIWKFGWQCAGKYAGYFLGKRYRRLGRGLILKCTANPGYWGQIWGEEGRGRGSRRLP